MKEEILPIHIPPYPSPYPYPGESMDDVKERITKFFDYCEWSREENERRSKKAAKTIGRCAFLRGFLNPFNPHLDFHYSWCPYRQWVETEKLFVNTPKAYKDFEQWDKEQQERGID